MEAHNVVLIPPDFKNKDISFAYKINSSRFRVNDEDVRLMLWDTAGQEEFDAITKAYYRGKLWVSLVCLDVFFWLNKEFCLFCSP